MQNIPDFQHNIHQQMKGSGLNKISLEVLLSSLNVVEFGWEIPKRVPEKIFQLHFFPEVIYKLPITHSKTIFRPLRHVLPVEPYEHQNIRFGHKTILFAPLI